MKIIHLVLGKANPDRMNGVNKLVFEMLRTQHQLGFDVELWGITKVPQHDYPERNFKTRLFPLNGNKLNIHTVLKSAIQRLSNPTVVHFHGSFIPEFYHIGKLLRKINIPYVYTPHGALAPAAMKRSALKKSIYFRFFEKHLLEHAACLIATGKSVFDHVDTLAKPKRKAIIPNGQPLIQRSECTTSGPMVFGFCGRIAMEHKGLDLLLEGYKMYKDRGGRGTLHLIGDGAEMPKFKQLAADLGVLEKLTLHGAKFGAEKFRILSGFDVFVHTSRMEGFPAAVLEASAVGLPVMISQHTNVWDYISKHDCGLLIDPNTPTQIARGFTTFEEIYKTSKFEEMGEGARQMINQHFDWKAICKRLYDEYALASKLNPVDTKSLL